MTDQQLLTAYAVDGSEEAFRALVARYVDMVYAVALRKSETPDMAEDVTQAVFIVLARRARRIRNPQFLPAWLLQTTRYCAADARRSAARRRIHETEAAIMNSTVAVPESTSDIAEVALHLDAALDQLAPADRAAILLRYYQQQTSTQIGESLGLSDEAVRKRLSRALEKLRKIFTRTGITFSAAILATAVTKQAIAAPLDLAEKTCTIGLSKTAATSTAALIAKGALNIMAWSVVKTTALAAVFVLVLAGAMFAAIHFAGTSHSRPIASLPPTTFIATAPASNSTTFAVYDLLNHPVHNVDVAPEESKIWLGTHTDFAGRATLTDIGGSSHHIVFYSERSRRMAIYHLLPGQSTSTLNVALDCFNALADGIVTDASGNPVKGAAVRLFVSTPDGEIFRFDGGKSDNNGYFGGAVPARNGLTCWATVSDDPNDPASTPHLAMGNEYQVELADLVIHTDTAPAPGPVLKRVHFSGHVVDEQNNPIPNVEIAFSYPKNQMTYEAGSALTDAKGRFSRLLPPDADTARIEIRLTAADFLSYHFDDAPTPSLDALKNGAAIITMKRGLPLSGTITDAATDKPIFNALVLAGRLYSSALGEVIEDFTSPRTDEDGHFTAIGLPSGSHTIRIIADGYAPELMTINLNKDSPPLNVQLQSGLVYSGIVVDVNGDPLADARVSAEEWTVGGQRIPIPRLTTTDASGHFAITDLPRRGTVGVYFAKKGTLNAAMDWSSTGTNLSTIALYPDPVISGTVIDYTTDLPVKKFKVFSTFFSDDTPYVLGFGKNKKVNSATGKFSLVINGFIDSLTNRSQIGVRIVADGYLSQFSGPVTQDGGPHSLTIRLHPAAPLTGTIVDAGGSPVAGARVFSVGPKDDVYIEGIAINDNVTTAPKDFITTKDDGLFKLSSTESPTRILALSDVGYTIVNAADLQPDADLPLTSWATIDGTVEVDGKPLNGETVMLAPPYADVYKDHLRVPKIPHFSLTATTDAKGRFRFAHVPNMPLMLGQSTGFGISSAQLVHPQPGKNITVNIDSPGLVDIAKLDLSTLTEPVDPKWIGARAFRTDPAIKITPDFDSAFDWKSALASLKDQEPLLNTPLSVFQNSATTLPDGSLRFENLSPGHYVAYINVHVPPPFNTSGIGCLLAHARTEFTVTDASPHVHLPAVPLERQPTLKVGDTAPEIQSTTFTGEPFTLSSLHGKFVLLNFWGSYHPPSMTDMPTLQATGKKWAAKNLALIGGNFDWDPEVAQKSIRQLNPTSPQLQLGDLSYDHPVAKAYSISALPTIFLISPEGKILARDIPIDQLDQTLTRALNAR